MLPAFRQRLCIAAAILIGGLCWLLVSESLSPEDASTGITLSDARVGALAAAVLVVLAGLPALGLGTLAAAMANPLAGPFVVGTALMMPVWRGGAGYGWLWRSEPPASYVWLAMEMVWWLLFYLMLMGASRAVRLPLRRRLPRLTAPAHQELSLLRGGARASTWLALAVSTVVSGLLSYVLIQGVDVGQVLLSLVLAFAIGGLVAQATVPDAGGLGVVLSPLVVGVIGYVLVSLGDADTPDQMRALVYAREVSGFAWTLPIHYASAGVAGACLGVGIGQGWDLARSHAAAEE